MKKIEITEIDVLKLFVQEMENNGVSRELMHINADEEMASKLSNQMGIEVPLEQLRRIVDKCFAHEWLERRFLDLQYDGLVLTGSGLGAVRSKIRQQEAKRTRTFLKKFSDYIEDHKGLFVALGVGIGIAGLLIKLA